MKPQNFDFYRPNTLEQTIALLSELGDDGRVIAGGQSLMAMLNLRMITTEALIDISRLEELSYCKETDKFLEIGAAVSQAELMDYPNLSDIQPLLAKALPSVGHFQTRNQGTVCGSLAHADPSSELPLCLATLGGEVILQSTKGERILSAAEFQTGMLQTAIREDELIVAVRFPRSLTNAGYAFSEVTRRHGDFAIVALAGVACNGTLRLGVGGVAGQPTVCEWEIEPEECDEVLNQFAWEMEGVDDIHATAQYRRQIVRKLGRKVLEEAKLCSK
ncbi:MAG: carbon monoxide dehydrogenase [Rhodospirillaceae bacterium]|nr:carbon monoxide dehydrogenase [Rhodospirillaceae bacterium]OUT76240.1 MAG: carbon monoxide dehydrogenase [Rhodospirillaceae bacterium TMED23]|tara:strand:+ start:2192 stop:3016 length:825 start_codon:yes stop_codon:yes gene_type:complete